MLSFLWVSASAYSYCFVFGFFVVIILDTSGTVKSFFLAVLFYFSFLQIRFFVAAFGFGEFR